MSCGIHIITRTLNYIGNNSLINVRIKLHISGWIQTEFVVTDTDVTSSQLILIWPLSVMIPQILIALQTLLLGC